MKKLIQELVIFVVLGILSYLLLNMIKEDLPKYYILLISISISVSGYLTYAKEKPWPIRVSVAVIGMISGGIYVFLWIDDSAMIITFFILWGACLVNLFFRRHIDNNL